jgi:hypothetical protein
MNELATTALLCILLSGGETEMRHYFPNAGETRHVRVDCETPTHVIEVALDNTASARDSLHQALFAEHLTGKTPMVLVIDTDGVEDRYQYEARIVAERAGVAYGTCSRDFIRRWMATAPFRSAGLDKNLNDLPQSAAAARQCDLGGVFLPPPLE